MLVTRPDDLNLITRIHTGEGENQIQRVVLYLMHGHYTPPHKINFIFKLLKKGFFFLPKRNDDVYSQ